MERVAASGSYTCLINGIESAGRVEFIARVKDSSKGYSLLDQARRAAARREAVKLAAITVTGIVSI